MQCGRGVDSFNRVTYLESNSAELVAAAWLPGLRFTNQHLYHIHSKTQTLKKKKHFNAFKLDNFILLRKRIQKLCSFK